MKAYDIANRLLNGIRRLVNSFSTNWTYKILRKVTSALGALSSHVENVGMKKAAQ